MITDIITELKNEVADSFDGVYEWFNCSESVQVYSPKNGGWSIRKILEHISLTNHYLLILINKGAVKSAEMAKNQSYQDLLTDYKIDRNKIEMIAMHGSFEWNRPEHMEPTGKMPLTEIAGRLDLQKKECYSCLENLKNGEGILYKTMMSVNNIGKIDVYHYILFLCNHAKRHIRQMEKIRSEFENL